MSETKLEEMFSLAGRVAVIFGGTTGIGRAVAQRFAVSGATVAVVGRRKYHETGNPKITFFQGDVTLEESVVDVLRKVGEQFGQIDIVVNNAGTGVTQLPITEDSIDNIKKIIDVNILGVINSLKHSPKFLKDTGSIINTSSVGAYLNISGYGSYSMSKAAVISLTKTSAVELGPRGIRVNAVCPGSIQTEMLDRNPRELDFVETFVQLGRVGKLSDIVGVYHFLAAAESRYITGVAIPVDGGLLAGLSNHAIDIILDSGSRIQNKT
jgi:NAD(P)-dependent dehydrogenase (short-subunit alcohol dehydrogenase family)